MTVTVTATGSTEELVRAASEGSLHAGEQLVQRYAGVVWATVRRFRLRDADAQDAVQGTWLLMFEHLGSVRDADRLPAWLATTARRECLRILQQSRRCVLGLESDMAERADESAPNPERSAVDRAMGALLWKHVADLPPAGRDLLMTLVTTDAHRYAEYARATGMPIGSIGPRRMRYLRTLRQRLEKAGLGAHAWR